MTVDREYPDHPAMFDGGRRWGFLPTTDKRKTRRQSPAARLVLEALEPRILLSGDPSLLWTTALTPVSGVSTSTVSSSPKTPAVSLAHVANTTALDPLLTPAVGASAAIRLESEQVQTAASPIAGTLAVPGQIDTYTFSLSAATTIYFDSLTNSGSINWSLTGPSGQIVHQEAFSSSDSYENANPVLSLGQGAYSLTIAGTGATTGAYAFRLLDLSTATPITPGVAVSDTLSPGNSTNAYQFSGTAGERVFMDAQTGGANTYWRLVDPNGQVVANSGSYFSDVQPTLSLTGTYTLLVEGYPYATTTSQPFSFTLFPQADTSAALSLNTLTDGTVAQPGQLINFTFAVSAQTNVLFDSLTNNGNLDWSLTGPSGVVVSQRSFNGSDSANYGSGSDLIGLTAGSYTLTVQGNDATTGSYAFRLLTLASGTGVTYGSTISATLGDAGASGNATSPGTETNLYSFTGSAGDQIQLQSATASGGNVYERLFDPYGNQIDANYLNNLGAGAVHTLLVSGTYTLAIEGYVSNTTAAPFSLTLARTGTTTISGFTGTALNFSTAASGTFAAAGESDDYVFSITNPEQILFDPLITPYGTSLNATWQLDGPTGAVITPQNFYNNQLVSLTVPGTYRLRVINDATIAGQAYSFQVLNIAAATPITYGNPVSGTLNPGTQTYAYAFSAAVGDIVYFDALTNTGDTYWQLLNPLGQSIFSNGFSATGPTTLTMAGTYTLLVGGQYYNAYNNSGGSSFSFAVDQDINTTTALTLGATVTGSITQPGQSANYTFSLGSVSNLYFDSLLNQSSIDWTLTGPTGTVVSARNLYSYENQVITLSAGAYTLSINANGGASIGAYSFRMLDLTTTGTSFNIGDVVSGSGATPQTTGVYQFSGTAGQSLYFNTLSNGGDGYLQWQVIDPFGNTVFSARGFSPVGTETLSATGIYTVLVEGTYYDTTTAPTYSFQITNETTTSTPITLGGPAQVGPFSVPGQVGTALNFTGAETVTTGDAALDLRNSLTIGFWIDPEQYGAPWNAIVYKGDGANANTRTFGVFLNSSGQIDISSADASGEQHIITATGVVPLDQWTQVTAVFDRTAGTMSIYINGVLAMTGALRTTPAVDNGYPVTIAGQQEGFYAFEGSLDDVRIFSNAQDATQIAGNYQTALTGTEAGLQLYLPMNEASGATTLTDASPNHAAVTVTSSNAGLAGTITGQVAAPGNTNKYTFTLTSATQLVFDGLTDNSNITITLTGPNELSVTRNLRNGDTFEFGGTNPVILAPAGQYTISVTQSGGGTGTYAFRFIDLSQATPVSVNTVVSGTLADGGQTNAYSFSATAGQTLYLNLLSWSKGGSDADFRLIDPYGNQVFGPNSMQDVGRTVLTYTGTYTLLIEGRTYESNESGPGTYSFRLDTVADQTIALTLGTNPAPGPVWTTGQLGGAVDLTGTNVVSVADSASLDLTDNVTMQAWINVDQMPSTWSTIFYKGTGQTSDGTQRTYSLWLNGNGSVLLSTATAAGQEYIQTAGGLVTPGAWVEITAVIDRSNGEMHIYIDGVDQADSTISSTLAIASSNPLLIGGTQEADGSFSNFQGSIDDVRLWSTALTAAQVAANYAAPLTGPQAGLALYLPLNEASGAVAADSSGNGNIATILNANANGVTGEITSPGQQVNYNFTVTTAGQYYFDSLIDNSSFYWSLTGPQGAVVSGRNFTASDANRGSPLLNLQPGSYVLTVYASGATTGYFNLRLLPLTTTQTLTPGTPSTITLNPGAEAQLYTFTATAGEQVYFDQTGQTGGNILVRIIDPLGHDLYGAVDYNSLPSFGVQTLAVAGTYTVLFDSDVYYQPNRSTIVFNVQPVVNKTATLALGTAVSGSIDTAGQMTTYTFNIATATTAYFDSLTNNGNLTWTLSGPNGTLVSARAFTNSDSYDQSNVALPLAIGAYTLTVRASNDSTGAFAFNLLDFAAATALAANTPTSVSLPALTSQLYSFSGTVGERVQLLSTVVSGDVTWRLLDPNGNVVFGVQSLTTEPPVVTLAYAGNYTLAIEGRIYTDSPITATLELIPLSVPAINGAVLVSVPANQSTPVDLGYFAAGTYKVSGSGIASLVSSFNDPNAILVNADGSPEVPVTRPGFGNLNPSGSPLDVPDGNIYGPGGSTINLGAVMGTLTANPTSPSDYFTIGEGTTVVLAAAGHIYAQVNDTAYGDNNYGFAVAVTPATVATGATVQTFAAAGLPYSLSTYGGTPATVVTDATGTFLRLTSAATSSQSNVVDFSSTATGPSGSVQAGFDFRITPGTTGGLGIGAVLLNGPTWGSSGPSTSYAFIPSVTDGLGVKLSVSDDGNNNQVALTWNGTTITTVGAGFNLSSGLWGHAVIQVQRTDGGSLVSVILTPNGGLATTVISNVFVGGYYPIATRLALEATTDSRTASQDIDNVSITTTPVTTAIATLALNSVTTGTISAAGAVEQYQFTLTSPITAIFDGLTNGSFYWTLTGPTGNVITGRSFTSSDTIDLGSTPALALAAGQYTLSISSNGNTGAFAFKLDDLASATPITFGTALTGTLDPGNSSDLYSFTATAGQKFSLSSLTGWTGYQYYQVLGPNGQQILSGQPLYQNSDAFTAPVAGTYTLLIEGRYYATTPSGFGFTLSQATDKTAALPLNTVISNTIDTPGQRAIYTVTLTSAAVLYFDSLTYDGDFTWTLTGPDGLQVASQAFSNGDFGAFAASAGTYTLTISNPNNDGHTGAFSFRLLDLATDATAITPGIAVSGTLDVVNGAVPYSFTAAADSRLYFDARTYTNNIAWQLFDQFGNSVFSGAFTTQGFVTLTAGGAYTLVIQGVIYDTGTATYTFNLQPPVATTTALTLGAVSTGSIAAAGETNAFTFSLTQPTLVVLAALTDQLDLSYSGSLTYTIMGALGVAGSGTFNRADGTWFGGTGSPALSLAAGAYTLTITPTNDETGTYSFRLLNLAAATPLTLGTPVSGSLTPGSDTRTYSFTATAGERIDAQETSYSGGNLIWRLLDPNNIPVFYSGFGSSPGAYTLPVSGTYTLLLEGYIGDSTTTAATYGFTIAAVATDPDHRQRCAGA
jgi:hypothetical protein